MSKSKRASARLDYAMTGLKQTQRLETGVVPAPDNKMIMNFDLQGSRSGGDFAGHGNVAAARRRVAAGMIVDEDER